MIPHNFPTLGPEEQSAISRVIQSGWVAQGPEVEAFERELCQFFNIPHGNALVVSSGTAALYLALLALDGKNKKIGLPVYACSALTNAVALLGGNPHYLDCQKNVPNISLEKIDSLKIEILIAPSMYGIPIDIPVTSEFKIIEDIAQSIGATSFGERIGLRGEIGICSFYATKLMTTGGQGGAVISRHRALIDKIRDYREFDCRDDKKPRFNFKMTDIQAAIGRVQLARLDEFIERRENLFRVYRNEGIELLDSHSTSMKPVRYRAVMRVKEPKVYIDTLRKKGITAISPLERWELLDQPDAYPNAAFFSSQLISLPIYPSLTEMQAKEIALAVREIA